MFIDNYKIEDFQAYINERFSTLAFAPLAAIEKAGEGNMNYTLRLKLEDDTSIIIKQAPPYCAKFPDIAAPEDRILVESEFYSLVHNVEAAKSYFPKFIGVDSKNKIMLIEDLGQAEDFSFLYQQQALSLEEARQITDALSAINAIEPQKTIRNEGMRALNHAHIFDIPLQQNNGLELDDITPGLNAEALSLKTSEQYKQHVTEIGEQYFRAGNSHTGNLSAGTHLLHGDYYPGSWLKCESKIAIIDPEFGFTGPVEFDVGNLLAHMVLSQQSEEIIQSIFNNYQAHHRFDESLALQFAGTEIMRRLLGYAQLPLNVNLQTKVEWLALSHELVIRPSRGLLTGGV